VHLGIEGVAEQAATNATLGEGRALQLRSPLHRIEYCSEGASVTGQTATASSPKSRPSDR
jgi:hypothetical protein